MLPAINCHVGRRGKKIAVVRFMPIIIIDANWPAARCGCQRSTELITHDPTSTHTWILVSVLFAVDSRLRSVELTMDTAVASMEVNCR